MSLALTVCSLALTTSPLESSLLMQDDTADSVVVDPITTDPLLEEAPRRPAWDTGLKIDFNAGYVHTFQTSVDNGGELRRNDAWVGVTFSKQWSKDLNVGVRAVYGVTDYNWKGIVTSFGGTDSPWDNLQRLNLGALFTFTGINDVAIFGGPVLELAREDGAEFADGITGGGILGARWRLSDTLTIGGGLGVVDEIEDGIRVFPIFILDWEITPELSLVGRPDPRGTGGGGIEAVWDWSKELDLALGVTFRTARFRLDDTGYNPGGAIEEEDVLIYLRGGWNFSAQGSVDFFAGLVNSQEYTAINSSSNKIAGEDVDPVGMLGFQIKYRF